MLFFGWVEEMKMMMMMMIMMMMMSFATRHSKASRMIWEVMVICGFKGMHGRARGRLYLQS